MSNFVNLESSGDEDDDDCYVSSVARLRALKKNAPIVCDDSQKSETSEIIPKVTNDVICVSAPPVPKIANQAPSVRSQRANNRRSLRNRNCTDNDDDVVAILETSVDLSSPIENLPITVDEDNYNVDVKVKWKSREIVRLELRKYQSFEHVFKHFANLEGVSEKHILILKNNKPILTTDTPASLNLRVIDILEGGLVNAGLMTEDRVQAEETCKIKVQMSTKQKIIVDLKMNETFKTVVMNCAEQLDVSPSRIKLSFDGDEIALTDTPQSLDLEQEACIDLRILPA